MKKHFLLYLQNQEISHADLILSPSPKKMLSHNAHSNLIEHPQQILYFLTADFILSLLTLFLFHVRLFILNLRSRLIFHLDSYLPDFYHPFFLFFSTISQAPFTIHNEGGMFYPLRTGSIRTKSSFITNCISKRRATWIPQGRTAVHQKRQVCQLAYIWRFQARLSKKSQAAARRGIGTQKI